MSAGPDEPAPDEPAGTAGVDDRPAEAAPARRAGMTRRLVAVRHLARPPVSRRVVAVVVVLALALIEARSQSVQREAAGERSRAAGSRLAAAMDHDARRAIEDEIPARRRDDEALASELAAARGQLVELEAAMAASGEQQRSLTAQVEVARGDLDRALATLYYGGAALGDLRVCVDATQKAVNAAAIGLFAGARDVLARAHSACARATGGTP